MWVVDTCVLIDLLRRDETFATLARPLGQESTAAFGVPTGTAAP